MQQPLRPNKATQGVLMDQYRVLGHPIAHSKSPQIHARFAELTGQALQYERLLVPLDGFAATLERLQAQGIKGCNVTVPFKQEAFARADQVSARVELAQAANTLSWVDGQVLADNTDGLGLVRDIEVNAGRKLQGLNILLLGAGGAAAGVLGPLLLTGPARIAVANRTAAKAHALVEQHRRHPSLQQEALGRTELMALPLDAHLPAFDVVINATAGSLEGAAPPIDARALKPGALVYDMMYGPKAEPFLRWAGAHGAQTRDGLGMLVEQAAESFFIWRGIRPPAHEVLAQLRAAL
jgi:shikimate dehydrogenase